MKVLFCSSEVVPFAKTGGLADVAGTLPPALEEAGVQIKIVMPRYRCVDVKKFKLKKLDDETFSTKIGKNVEVLFLEKKRFFDRDGLYQQNGLDYPDNLDRFTYYCLQTLNLIKKINFKPDIIHCNDWQAGLIPIYLKETFTNDQFYKNIKTIFTIHNLGYQGLFPKEELSLTGLSKELFSVNGLEFYGKINLLKGGLLFSDFISTVSSTYAQEIQSAEFGCGLEGVLQQRKKDIIGILNGINYDEWDPRKNKTLIRNYGPDSIEGKYENKEDLQKLGKLKVDRKIPLLGIITRLADQKGLDILAEVIEEVVQMPVQFILLGTGDPRYHKLFEGIGSKYKNTSIHLKFDAALAYKIYAGSDIFLMPSYYEPCGLGQLISLNFGTIPLVRRTGGLADTVEDFDPFTKKGNGFVFSSYQAGALLEALKRSLCVYNDAKTWRKLITRAINSDFSWKKSAKEYVNLYKSLKSK
ncbi:MAG: glycogen synthase GlgA [Candidatus Omnitrophica bacterium]|nr:glycogen synthase GlgA [Candidatus Omnitrophota bacterium]